MKHKLYRLSKTALVLSLFAVINARVSAQVKDPNPQKTLKTMVTRAVDSFFLRNCIKDEVFSTNKPKDMTGNDKGYDIWEFKEFKYELKPIRLTGAEKLNGYDFKGDIIINAKNYRKYHFCGKSVSADNCNAWQEWQSFEAPLSIHIAKKAGEWSISAVDQLRWVYLPGGSKAPDCSAILKIK